MPIANIIRERRRELGLTQEQVARSLGVSAPAVNKWERGASYPGYHDHSAACPAVADGCKHVAFL